MICSQCDFRNLEDAESCVRCGYLFEVLEEDFEAEPIIGLAEVRGYTAGFLQLNDIARACSAGTLAAAEVAPLLQELLGYLHKEEQRFLDFELLEGEDGYNEGVDLIASGLSEMADLVQQGLERQDWSAPTWATLLESAMDAEAKIRQGTDQLGLAEEAPADLA